MLRQWQIQRGVEGTFAPPPKKRERGWRGVSSVPLLNIFIHMPVKCNKSLYIFTRCIVLLVYLITFELLKQSTIDQKTKWYYNPLTLILSKSIHYTNTSIKLPHFQQKNMRKLANTGTRYIVLIIKPQMLAYSQGL